MSRKCLLLLSLLTALSTCSLWSDSIPLATAGVLDLRGHDPYQIVTLDGTWDLFWESLGVDADGSPLAVMVPGGWSDAGVTQRGYATYRLRIKRDQAGQDLALRLVHVNGAFAVSANGQPIGGRGRVGASRSEYVPGEGVVTLLIHDADPEIEIVVQVSNFEARDGGLVSAVQFGTEEAIYQYHSRALNRHFFLIGVILTMGLYHLGLFINRPKDRSTLYFGFFALFYLGWQFMTGENYGGVLLAGVPWGLLRRFEYVSFHWFAGFFFTFIAYLFPKEFDRRVLLFFLIGAGLFSAFTLAAPMYLVTRGLTPFQLLFVITLAYCLFVLVFAAIRHRFGASLILAGVAVAALAAVNDVLYFDQIVHTAQITGYGIAAFLLFQAFFLSRRFARSFEQVETLSVDLEGANEALLESQKRIEVQHDEMVRLAHQDHLTGLPNRLVLFDTITKEISRAQRNDSLVAVMLLDLDEFKDVNDSMGHQAGDELLQKVGRRLSRVIRHHDVVFRLGGDEFTIVILDTESRRQIDRVADKIVRAFGPSFEILGREVLVKASVGISVYPDDGRDVHTLIKNADTAMYRVKKGTKGRFVFFDASMAKETQDRINLSGKLARALAQGHFQLHYQPQVHESGDTIFGVEALVRWSDPEEGLIPPGRFIPVAEETGLIVDLGEWIIGEACRQAREWRDAGIPPLSIAVNISALQFSTDRFVEDLAYRIKSCGVGPENLVLELTERVIMQDEEQVIAKLLRLKELGLKISIDDFGSGYSSLNYLRRFPLDHLKIDQSFVREMFNNEYDSEIVRTIIHLARVLDLKVVAEGVENEEQRAFLVQNKCHLMQGYLFGRPLPGDETQSLLIGTPSVGSR